MNAWKISEVARRTGLTIRTLHHYDEIGLLQPSLHTEAGHRLYTDNDLARLQQVLSLRQLGFSLDEIHECLDRANFSPLELVRSHLAKVQQQIELQQQLHARLRTLAELFRTAEAVSAEAFLKTIEAMTRTEKMYTPEQMQQFGEVGKLVGPEEIREIEDAWMALLLKIQANRHLDPTSPEARALADRWSELTAQTMRGYAAFPELKQAIKENYEQGQFAGFAGAPQAADFAFIASVEAARAT